MHSRLSASWNLEHGANLAGGGQGQSHHPQHGLAEAAQVAHARARRAGRQPQRPVRRLTDSSKLSAAER
jgi:hypothetical protein